LNAAVKCSGEGINMADSVQLTQGGVYANRVESVNSRGWGLNNVKSHHTETSNGLS